jgi:hypothetical protein
MPEMRSPLDGFPVFYHWHPARLKGIGGMGWWFLLWDGSTVLVPSIPGHGLQECVGSEPLDNGMQPCSRCGWKPEWRKDVQT